mmetsp:Transcript_6476/g.12961  ORF Transcript_6476/g.12961 Transcript_6476/m.12961 type:complete len:228 (-) Transcript_6476:26-709(-)
MIIIIIRAGVNGRHETVRITGGTRHLPSITASSLDKDTVSKSRGKVPSETRVTIIGITLGRPYGAKAVSPTTGQSHHQGGITVHFDSSRYQNQKGECNGNGKKYSLMEDPGEKYVNLLYHFVAGCLVDPSGFGPLLSLGQIFRVDDNINHNANKSDEIHRSNQRSGQAGGGRGKDKLSLLIGASSVCGSILTCVRCHIVWQQRSSQDTVACTHTISRQVFCYCAPTA